LINAEYDKKWLDSLAALPDVMAQTSHLELLTEAGSEGLEIIMWLVMRGALDAQVREVHRHYHVPASNSAYGLLVLENA
jgi:protocatechuate 4,5-dioxygenase beta chain